jgi:dienelactone hydrolase
MEEPITFASEGLELKGVLALPEGGTRRPRAAVLVHGWSGTRHGPHDLLVATARALAEAGVPAIRFDLRGRGESGGAAAETSLDGMIADAVAAAGAVRSRTGAERIAVVGLCSGGNVAIGAATLCPEIDELVLWSTLPFASSKRAADGVRRTGHFAGRYLAKLVSPRTWWRLVAGAVNVKAVWRVLFGHFAEDMSLKDSSRDIMSAFAGYRGRALFVYGGRDPEAVGARKHYEEFAAAQGLRADFRVIEGSNHNFYSIPWKRELVATTLEWLGPAPAD